MLNIWSSTPLETHKPSCLCWILPRYHPGSFISDSLMWMLRPRRLRCNWGREDTRTSPTQAPSSQPASPPEPVWPVYCFTGSIQIQAQVSTVVLNMQHYYDLMYPVFYTLSLEMHKNDERVRWGTAISTLNFSFNINLEHLTHIDPFIDVASVCLVIAVVSNIRVTRKYSRLPRDWSGSNPPGGREPLL